MGSTAKKTPKGARSKTKRVAKTVPVDDVQEATADPWAQLRSPLGGRLSPAEEWKRLQDPASRGRTLTLIGDAAHTVLQASTSEAFSTATSAVVQVKTPGHLNDERAGNETESGSDERPIERLVLRGENLSSASTSGLARRLLTTALVLLDVDGSELENSDIEVLVTWTPWLRGLSVAGNRLTKFPSLSGLVKLQELNLAHNQIDSLPAGCFPNELGMTLRKLNLEGNRLNGLDTPVTSEEASRQSPQDPGRQQRSARSPLHDLPSLVDLNLAGNRFESIDHSLVVFSKAGFPRLVSLDVQGNNLPNEEETLELRRIVSEVPTLKVLNGEEVSRKAMTISSKQPIFELLSTGDQCTKEGRREESCSCIEGNPCAVAYHCRNWANRFEVAAAAAASSSSSSGGMSKR